MTPAFGYLFAFKIPDDWIRTRKLAAVPTLDPPLLQMAEETGYWYTNLTPIFVSYVSNDPTYGMNIGMWPEHFVDYVALRLARQACLRIANDKELKASLQKDEDRARRVASRKR